MLTIWLACYVLFQQELSTCGRETTLYMMLRHPAFPMFPNAERLHSTQDLMDFNSTEITVLTSELNIINKNDNKLPTVINTFRFHCYLQKL